MESVLGKENTEWLSYPAGTPIYILSEGKTKPQTNKTSHNFIDGHSNVV